MAYALGTVFLAMVAELLPGGLSASSLTSFIGLTVAACSGACVALNIGFTWANQTFQAWISLAKGSLKGTACALWLLDEVAYSVQVVTGRA